MNRTALVFRRKPQCLKPSSGRPVTDSDFLASEDTTLVTTAARMESYSVAFSASAAAAGASLASFDSGAAAPLSPVGSVSEDVQSVWRRQLEFISDGDERLRTLPSCLSGAA